MERIKTLANILAIAFSIGFCDGAFGLGFSEEFYVFVGLIVVASLIWIQIDIRKIMKK